jgi:hypothetical protein
MTFGYDSNIKLMAAKNLMAISDHAVSLLARIRNERAVFPVGSVNHHTRITKAYFGFRQPRDH